MSRRFADMAKPIERPPFLSRIFLCVTVGGGLAIIVAALMR